MTPIPFLARPYSPAWFTEAEAQSENLPACRICGDSGRGQPTLQEPDGAENGCVCMQLQQIAADNGCEAVVLDTTPSVEIAPWDVIPDWQQEAEALAAEDADWYATRESDRPL